MLGMARAKGRQQLGDDLGLAAHRPEVERALADRRARPQPADAEAAAPAASARSACRRAWRPAAPRARGAAAHGHQAACCRASRR